MRFDLQSQSASPAHPSGDLAFIGGNQKAPRESLPEGYLSRFENVRLRHGAGPRDGTRTPVFANLFALTRLKGSGVYSNPNGDELGLLATANGTVIGIRSGVPPITIAAGVFTADVEFVQHFDKVLAHQSDSQPTLIWDGLSKDVGFIPIEVSVLEPGILVIPNPDYSVPYLGRAWFPIPDEPDAIGASDVNDPTTYDSDRHSFRVNTGTSDKITGIYPFLGNNLIIGKERSIDILYNIPDDLGDSFLDAIFNNLPPQGSPQPPQVHSISDQIGITARKTGIIAGGRFMFLSSSGRGGVYQVTTDQHGNYIVDQTPVSDPIEPIIQRINWSYADKSVAQLVGTYVKFAVPLDGSTYNNAMLVLNLSTGQWESLDLWNATPRRTGGGRVLTDDNPMRMDNLVRLNYYGNADLFAINHDKGKVHRMYHGTDDQLNIATGQGHLEQQTYPIQSIIETRGYNIADTNIQSKTVDFGLATFEPNITIDLLLEGSDGDELTLTPTPIMRSRAKYDLQKPNFVVTNQNDDFEAPKREDYSVHMDDNILLKTDGVRMQRVWPWTRSTAIDAEGSFVSFRVSNNGGICEVRNVVFLGALQRTERTA